jgi:Uma2 family endonuclease
MLGEEASFQMTRRRFTVHEYQSMGVAGILSEDDLVELIDGDIVQTDPISPGQAACVVRFNQRFHQALDDATIVSVRNPLRLGPFSEPQPDIALLRPRDDWYAVAHPTMIDAYAVIEVADASLAYDRGVKLPLYAHAEIPEVWLVDLNGERIERHTEPRNGAYRRIDVATRGETIVSAALPALALEVDAILGPRPAADG